MRYSYDILYAALGGHFGWVLVPSEYTMVWVWHFLYWPNRDRVRVPVIVLLRIPLVILAGYMSRSRGLHWDRKRR